MFSCYRDAGICIVYLVDVPVSTVDQPGAQIEAFRKSRWFTRGWSSLRPARRQFWASGRSIIDDIIPTGHVRCDILDLISDITRINEDVLRYRTKLQSFCAAERMSWSAHRQTTRSEDTAYSLIRLFNVNMPIL